MPRRTPGTRHRVLDARREVHPATSSCYGVAEYLGATQTSGGAIAATGGDRRLWKEPAGAIIGGVHRQQDVFFGQLP